MQTFVSHLDLIKETACRRKTSPTKIPKKHHGREQSACEKEKEKPERQEENKQNMESLKPEEMKLYQMLLKY